MSISTRSAVVIAVFGMSAPVSCFAAEPLKHDIRGAVLGMSLGQAMDAMTGNGAVCGKGVFDTHRCDFDSDTWIHLHAVGSEKTVQSIKYTYPALNNQSRFAIFKDKVIGMYHLGPIDNGSKYVTPEGYTMTIVDGEIDLENAAGRVPVPVPDPGEPKL